MSCAIETSRRIMRASKEPFDWVAGVTAIWSPPQGYVCDNGQNDETTAVLMILLEGMLPEPDEEAEHKELFLECCAKIWEDNLKVA